MAITNNRLKKIYFRVLLHLSLGVHNFFEGNDYHTTSGINIRRIFLDYMTKFGFTIEDLQNIFFCTDQGSNVLKVIFFKNVIENFYT